jgi:branched-subunit amino acid ABC-type transport system permease component
MFSNPTFVAIQVLNSLSLGMNLFIIASSLTLIYGVLRIINFAHGAFYMVGAYVLVQVLRWMGVSNLSFALGVLAGGVVMAAIAFFLERFFLARLYDKEHLLQLLFTFALVLMMGDVVKMIWGKGIWSADYPPALSGAVNLGFMSYPAYLLFLCVLGPIVALGLWLGIERTRWGRILRAARLDREMLGALGIDVKRVFSVVFVLGAAMAAIGGALAAPRASVESEMGALIIMDCFIIVIMGGLGSLWGAFIGAIGLGFITVFGTLLLAEWEIVLVYLVMIAVLLVRPWGLLGKPEVERV